MKGQDRVLKPIAHLSRFYQFLKQSAVVKRLLHFGLGVGITAAIATTPLPFNPLSLFPFPSHSIAVAQSVPDALSLLEQGLTFFQAEQFSQAVRVWQAVATAFKGAGEPFHEALALNYLSLAYQQLGQWQPATEAVSSCLSLLQLSQGKRLDSQRLPILAQALNTQGHLYYALGQSDQALTTWQEATALYEQLEDREGAIGSQINVAQAMQALGLYRRSRQTLGEVERALQGEPNSLLKATGLRSLGNALRAVGELEQSRELLQQSLTIAQSMRQPSAIASAQFSLGNTARAMAQKALVLNDSQTAEAEWQNALAAYRQVGELSTTSPRIRLRSQLNQLALLIDLAQVSEAEALLPDIQVQLDELPPSRGTVYDRIHLSHSLIKLFLTESSPDSTLSDRHLREIATGLATAVQQAKTLQDPRAESYALGSLGHLYELAAQSQEAQKLTQQALMIAQGIDASDIAYRWQWQVGRLMKEQGKKPEAVAAYTLAIDTLQSLRQDLASINPDNPDVQFSFRESVEPVYRELVDLLTDPNEAPTQENLRQARQAIESLQLAELDNFFQEACLDAKPIQIDEIDTTAAVIYPIILPERLAVIVAFPDAPLRLYTTFIPQSEIENSLNEIQQNIGRRAGNNRQVLQNSQQIYDWLIRPAEADLKQSQIQTLVFVLDGQLRNVPMAALHDGTEYLIENYSLALTPGLQLLPPQPLAQEEIQLLTAGLSEARQGFSALENVEQELQAIQENFTAKVLFNQEFTQLNLQEIINSSPVSVVHIATHGQFSSQAERTFILTWDGRINVKDLDSLLRQKEQELSRPIELLVFSACETASGDSRAALGLAGVAIRAGARSTIATLWQVSDESTAALMVQFYQELAQGEGLTKAEALRRAQVSLLREGRYRTPYFWSPYILVGNWR
ncbi:CHAT domain-containing protein [Laspinema sp. A4]|uniref:CHAT domain-containing protein n=1 Tax=Laspinema sp. D2d TaxID=2953686 RepID=UPI0021BA77C9|nr:CHAT domain-containing protein [Laspinema sp. D2d]MCT7985241.1 CHAT domain-containing protein [Laspinema sp. D2d]